MPVQPSPETVNGFRRKGHHDHVWQCKWLPRTSRECFATLATADQTVNITYG